MDVALVGVVLPGVENHSLGALAAALTEAGRSHRVVPFGGFARLRETVAQVIALEPRVCGVSLQTTESALATLAFTRLLREAGYRGTIAVGGHVASLAADEILAARADVDVVVELAGEAAIVGLARGEDPCTLPGAITRDGRGPAPRAVAPGSYRRAPGATRDHLGFGTADLVLSRGCAAHCGYCCVAAVSDRAEATGGARHATGAIDAIADELASLAARGVRAFHVMDDNLLPAEADAALAWARALRDALAARAVPPIAFSLQLRADIVSPALACELAALGLVRAYVGIDGYSAGQLRAIGRHAPATAANLALEAFHAAGVACVANALIVGPTLRWETIAAEVEALATVRHAPVHLLPIEARPGTVYHRRAAARGLIEGGLVWPHYHFEDARAFRVAEVLTRLPTRLVERSVPIALYDLAWAMGVAGRLAPDAALGGVRETYAEVTAAWNADQVRVLRAALAAALAGPDATAELLARERPAVTAHDRALLARCDRAILEVERAVSALHRRPVRAHARGRLLGRLAVTMSLAACSPSHSAPDAVVPDTAVLDAAIDAPWTCADPSLMPEGAGYPDPCACDAFGTDALIMMTYDATGVVTAVADQAGTPFPPDIEQCILDLLAPYCYPSAAGTTVQVNVCHSWIA
ncbi:MAG TPA: cobalamin-dependent protein [Kofleriaceae bacterium]|jgi:hypothetical protein